MAGLFVWSAWAEETPGTKPAAPSPEAPNPAPAKLPPPVKPKPKTAPEPAECVRTGQRVIAALARDDSGAANEFHNFYIAFKCPPQHLAQAFGCLVGLQTQHPNISNPSAEQVTQCWEDPSTIPEVKPPPSEPAPAQPK